MGPLHGGFLRLKSPSPPTSKAAPPLLQKQLALEHIAAVSSSVPAAPLSTSTAPCSQWERGGCAVFLTDVAPTGGRLGCRRLPNLSSSTYCEFTGTLLAVPSPLSKRLNGVVMCGLSSALQAISSPQPHTVALFIRSCFS
ncbi:hypothetical protein GWK47_040804 [Chionoecetes opilio]|uniref:Uncharacterized protein n=1 Tax=Chionoecetes opilio TaxID=41210 RepID=A0A8J4YJ06_CHIOP|nr:hypothetical protein GWK47_040804 [Chionoecetes opilio]